MVLSLIVVARAEAQPANPPGVDKLIEMNKKALRDYDAANWKEAKNTLLQAVSAGKKAKLETHGIMARTYLHLGVVWIAGFNDRPKAIWSFARALEIDATIRVRANMETPEISSAFEEAEKEVAAAQAAAPPAPAAEAAPSSAGASAGGGSAEAAAPAQSAPLDCPNSGEAPPEKAVPIKCTVASNLRVASLFLFYRGPGKKKFASTEMEKGSDGAYESEIPEEVVGEGGAIQYYVEGRNAGGKPIVSNGHSGSPNIMLVLEGAGEVDKDRPRSRKAQAQAEEAVEENPLDEDAMRRARAAGIARVRGAADARYGNRRFWIGLGGGSGAGYAKGDGLEARPDLQAQYEAGFGWAGLGHLVPEIGYQITPDIAVSVQGRVQWIPQAAQYQKMYSTGAQAVLARVLFFSRQQRLRGFGSLMAGGGTGFRFTLHPDHAKPEIKDTVRGGPGIAGVGGGLTYEMLKSISLVAEVNVLAGFPVFSAVADLNLGLQVNIY